ncbi:ABC transporter substrate-binding protein [Cryptosporangium aurantiacum]|uniref:Carbohydrate ABC transporter substrate-binding protein, CUT1 family n=1 Tax=Cryptosporangium aurantiacum TaxID=134849 RepID=A0A1M7Q918_9ACTN|nr:carbohydrate ABC transporter substrate-binding protein, CUT1 family [Cryptosporangium aurantiacum]
MVFGVPRKRAVTQLVASVGAVLLLASCSTGGSGADKDSAECEPYKKWAVDSDATVTIYSSIRDVEADRLEESWKQFEDCTGITIEHEGSGEFEAQLNVRVDGGNAPDLAFFPQPGFLASLAKEGKVKPAPAAVKTSADANYSADWIKYGTVDGKFYAAPLGANVKSFVWYSPKTFKEKGYTVPQTWDEMIALSDKIAATGEKPWCAGVESGDATGWPATDWLEDVLLRTGTPEQYDQWVNHQTPFNAPNVVAGLDKVGQVLKNAKYVNGGYGDVKSIVTTSFQEGGLPILENKCSMHRQASFYGNQWPEGTKVAEDGDVFAFYLPAIDAAKGKPVLGAGEFVGAFADRPEVQSVQEYLSTPDWANSRAKVGEGGWISANKGLDKANLKSPIDVLSVELLQDPKTVFRFDGSDQMPGSVGAGSFWKAMVAWLNGGSTKSALDTVEKSWPK